MKKTKKMCALVMILAVSFQLFSLPVYASPLSADSNMVICTFSNADFLNATEIAYSNGAISKQDYDTVLHTLHARIGIKGENKIVHVSGNLYDYYINNILWNTITTLGIGAVSAIIGAIPGVSAAVASIIAGVVGSVGGTLLSAERGVIIRVRHIDISGGIGAPRYNYEFISIREQ